MRKYIFVLFLINLFGCADEVPENQSLCIGELVESTGKYFCLQEMHNAFCSIYIVPREGETKGIIINCGTIEPSESLAFCASTEVRIISEPNKVIYLCDNELGTDEIYSCEYIIDNKIIIDGVERDIKVGEVRCVSKKHIPMHHNPLTAKEI